MDLEIYKLTPEEVEFFGQFKEQVEAEFGRVVASDIKLIRFLKGSNFDASRASKALKENIEWIELENVDNILEIYKPPEVLKSYFPLYILGLDLEQSPILVLELGTVDLNGIMKCTTSDAILKHVIYTLELGEKYMRANTKTAEMQRWFFLIDCKDFSALYGTNRTFRNFVKFLSELFGKHYPERLKTVWAINATPPLNQLLKFLGPSLPQITAAKVNIFGTTGWQEKLKEVIDPSILPEFFCGNVKEKDMAKLTPMTPIIRGGQVPKKCFTIAAGTLQSQPGVTDYTLKRSELFKVPVKVSRANSVLRWEFETENHSIGFGLEFSQNERSPPTTLIPVQRIYVDNFTETGEYLCEDAGIYTLMFDNSFSWVKSKQLFYKYTVSRA